MDEVTRASTCIMERIGEMVHGSTHGVVLFEGYAFHTDWLLEDQETVATTESL